LKQWIGNVNRRGPVGLIVEYRITDPRAAEVTVTGKLESLFLGPIGE